MSPMETELVFNRCESRYGLVKEDFEVHILPQLLRAGYQEVLYPNSFVRTVYFGPELGKFMQGAGLKFRSYHSADCADCIIKG